MPYKHLFRKNLRADLGNIYVEDRDPESKKYWENI